MEAVRPAAVMSIADTKVLKYLRLKPTRARGKVTGLLLARVHAGLPYAVVEALVASLGVSQKELGGVLNIPVTTLSRRKKTGKLLPDESDRVIRLARIGAQAEAMMDDDAPVARQWLTTPLEIFGESPLRHCSTEVGAREVEQLIGRLRHGVFS